MDLLPRRRRRQLWAEFRAGMGERRLPPLQRPRWVARLVGSTAAGLLAAAGIALVLGRDDVAAGLTGTTLAFALVVYPATAPLAVAIPAHCATVGGTVRTLVGTGYGAETEMRAPEKSRRWHRDEVWETLCGVIVEQLEVSPDEVTREARFVDDLGAD